MEQAFAFRVGIHLNALLRDTEYEALDLDSEYNKMLGSKKVTEHFPKGIRPDLLNHKRNTHEFNKMAVELKGYWAETKDIEQDYLKLQDLTSPIGNYNYLVGVFVLVGKEEADFEIFMEGEKITSHE